jgi:hypothetical protein
MSSMSDGHSSNRLHCLRYGAPPPPPPPLRLRLPVAPRPVIGFGFGFESERPLAAISPPPHPARQLSRGQQPARCSAVMPPRSSDMCCRTSRPIGITGRGRCALNISVTRTELHRWISVQTATKKDATATALVLRVRPELSSTDRETGTSLSWPSCVAMNSGVHLARAGQLDAAPLPKQPSQIAHARMPRVHVWGPQTKSLSKVWGTGHE